MTTIITSIHSIQNCRDTQEDTTISEWIENNDYGKILVLGVFDGHGGDYVSNYMQQEFLNIFKNTLEKYSGNKDITTLSLILKEAIKRSDSNIPTEYSEHGSTATIALFVHDTLIVANIGDSRIIRISKESKRVVPLSFDHTIKNEMEFDRVKDRIYFGRVCGILAMTRSIGDHSLRPFVSGEPDIFTYKLSPDDIIVLATDGLWDTIDNNTVSDIIHRVDTKCYEKDCVKPLELACKVIPKILVKNAVVRGSKDNISVIIARYSSESNIYRLHSY